jgi:nicotinamide-nucleotide amidase
MTAAVLCIGTELTRGELTNTNASWLASQLTELGFEVTSLDSVDDDRERIVEALHRIARTKRVMVVTGGLGPTSDDLTAECAARALGVPLVRDENALRDIERRFEKFGRPMSESNAKQADIPQNAEILRNPVGTAPGFAIHLGSCLTFFLPGVPNEMKRLFEDHVAPKVRHLSPNNSYQIRLKTFGLPESMVAEKIQDLETHHPSLTLGYRATFPEIEVKVLVRSSSADDSRMQAQIIANEVRQRLGEIVYGEGDDTLAESLGRAVRSRSWRLAVAESCTGGLVGHLLSGHPASDFFIASAVCYANSSKSRLLGVSEDTIRAHGAVSPEVAAAMAEGIRHVCDVDVALAITGIAGPTGGTPEKPVGLVYWAVAHPGGTTVIKHRVLPGDRRQIQRLAAFVGLSFVREICLQDDRRSSSVLKAAQG